MSKVILLSVLIGLVAIPVVVAREADARRGFRKVLVLILAFNLLYLLVIRYVYPRFL